MYVTPGVFILFFLYFFARVDSTKGNSKHICAIDVDEGIKLNLPLNQVRLLPPEMKTLPCQAIRIDIGLVSFSFLLCLLNSLSFF